ncbi:MAG: DUF1569 domain-containing protein [Pirellula sp.]
MQRRELRFAKLADISSDIDQLLTKGYQRTGKWDLSQICEHLADWMIFPIDGFPKAPLFVACILGVMRVTLGKSLFKKFVRDQRMSVNQPTDPATVHNSTQDSQASIDRLRKAIDRLASHRGPIHPSPLFGKMNYDELVSLQLAHCAHHLSFLVPNG